MKNVRIKKILSFFIAVIMLLGSVSLSSFTVFAEGEDVSVQTLSGGNDEVLEATTTGADGASGDYDISFDGEVIAKIMDAIPYSAYTQRYENVPKGADSIIINPSDYNAEKSTSGAYIVDAAEWGDGSIKGEALYTGGEGKTVFDVTVPSEGMYAIKIMYASKTEARDPSNDAATSTQSSEISTTIERSIYVDDNLPFSEASYFYFPRVWEYEYKVDENGDYVLDKNGNRTFIEDKNGNDTRPRRWEVPKWQDYYVRDWLGYEIDPLQFYFSAGEHTLTLVSNREEMIISKIELYPYEEEPLYKDWLADMKAKGVKEVTDVEPIKIQAETPDYISIQKIIPGNDRTSPLTEPQDPAVIKYNILDTPDANNWMKYEVTVPKSGLYQVSFRFRQNTLIGMFTSRRMKVNGEIQFREASYLRFNFDTGFQMTKANDGEQDFLFYLEEGKNEIEMEVVLGAMVDYVYQIKQCITELNAVYQKILMITGPVPDAYNDYGFGRLVPREIRTIGKNAKLLYDLEESIVKMTGEKGDQTNALNTYAELFEKMSNDEYEIAPNFLTFKNYIVSLSDWLYTSLAQPLKLDYILLQAPGEKLPPSQPNFIQRTGFELKAFFSSFTMDYTSIGFTSDKETVTEDVIEMWALADRESMLIQRYLVDKYFTPETNISLRIKVITAGLDNAILAGIGPDVSFMDAPNTITWGIRTAILPLEEMKGFDDLMKEFPDAMKTRLTMIGQDGKDHTYGIPTSLIFSMAFYRLDVLAELGLEPPQTWDELMVMFQKLLENRLEVGLPNGLLGTELFIYQQENGNLFKDDGLKINYESNDSLSAFTTMCEMFKKYNCPVAYEISRFRTGEIPIMIPNDAITTYNQLMTFYDIRGLWQMAPVIGTVQPDGSVNNNTIVETQAMVIPRGGYNPEVIWEFVKWYTGSDSQTRQARETIAVSNPTAKFSTANISALLSQKWTSQERAAIENQINNLVGVPEYPGAYIVAQQTQFAFLNAYNGVTEPSEALLATVLDINKELSRKRKELGLDYAEISYGNSNSQDADIEAGE